MVSLWLFCECIALAVLLVVAVINVFSVRELEDADPCDDEPRVSLLIPMRNERNNVDGLIRSLANQTYRNVEMIVLDDESTDDTVEQIRLTCANTAIRLRLVHGKPRPAGWIGKNFACHQLAQAASGDILLFVDADVRAKATAVAKTVSAMQASGVDFLSAFPEQKMQSLAEKLAVPLVLLALYALLPFPLIRWLKSPHICPACGQWLAVRRLAYDALGGHGALRSEVLEDIEFARRARAHGFAIAAYSGLRELSCQMYDSHRTVFEGFSKNAFACARFNYPAFIAFTAIFAWVNLAPFFYLDHPLAVVCLVLIATIKLVIALRFRIPWLSFLGLHPLSVLYGIAIALNSMRWHYLGIGHWRGKALQT